MFEEITLSQEKEKSAINTPLGMANATTGTLSHNHLTVIWDARYTTAVDHKPRLLENGSGNLTRIEDNNNKYRLRDDNNQLDFHIISYPRCIRPQPDCRKSNETYNVVGEDNIYMIIKQEKPLQLKTRKIQSNQKNLNVGEHFETYLKRQIQYVRDQLTDNENDLARAVHISQCDVRKLIHAQALSTAQYNGWLAASQLKLPTCTKLIALGQTALSVQCKPVNVTFTAEITQCGAQPKSGNFTINLDGWELVEYRPCCWTTGFVNFNGKPYVFRNKSWTSVEATIVLPHRDSRYLPLHRRPDVHLRPSKQSSIRGLFNQPHEHYGRYRRCHERIFINQLHRTSYSQCLEHHHLSS